jgi:hypothetical protein
MTRPIKITIAATKGCNKYKKLQKETFQNPWQITSTPAPKKVGAKKLTRCQPIMNKIGIRILAREDHKPAHEHQLEEQRPKTRS